MQKVFYCDISDLDIDKLNLSFFPKIRMEYINKINDLNRRKQSICVWSLLTMAFNEEGFDLYNAKFVLSEMGKWSLQGDPYHFSLSHSGNIVAVAISDKPIGVDVEKCSKKILKIKSKFPDANSIEELATLWTIKEAEYKCDLKGNNFSQKIKDKFGDVYILSVVTNYDNFDFINVKNIDLL